MVGAWPGFRAGTRAQLATAAYLPRYHMINLPAMHAIAQPCMRCGGWQGGRGLKSWTAAGLMPGRQS